MTEGFKYTGPGYYVTHDGRKASAAEHNGQLYGFVFNPDGTSFATKWGINGMDGSTYGPFYLVGPWIEPRKISGWVNVYEGGVTPLFATREAAEGCWPERRLACIYVTGTEGVEPEGEDSKTRIDEAVSLSESAAQLTRIEQWQAEITARERAEYERLKAKFEKPEGKAQRPTADARKASNLQG